jgi:protocatechuate 3,4-dioxygenase beta subunit
MDTARYPLVALLGTLLCMAPLAAQRDTLCREHDPTEASIRIAPPDEPGERLVITGRVLRGDDRSPVAGAKLLAYHTDSEGYYSDGGMDERNARLCGVLVTDAEGRYRIETIRPAHYATGGPPAHVHFELTLPGDRVRHFTLNFEGDPKLGGRPAGETWDTIRPLVEASGVLQVERDFWVR